MKIKLLIVMFFLFFMCSSAFAAAPDLSISTSTAFPGQTISVPVVADYAAATPGDAQFTLTYDPALLTFTSVAAGSATAGWAVVNNANTPGTVIVGMFNPSGTTITGSAQQIAVLNFTVNAVPGTPTITGNNLELSAAILGSTNITTLTNGNFTLDLLGDVNGDGKVTVADALLTAQAAIGITTLTAIQQTAAEVDGSAKVNIYDAELIAEYVAGVITKP